MPQPKGCTLTPHSSEQLGIEFESTLNGFCSFQNPYCWFAGEVTAAILVVKNKSNFLLWELNYFLYFFEKNFYCIDPQHGRLVTWLQTKDIPTILHLVRLIRTLKMDFYPIKNVLEAKINTVIILEINSGR